MTAFTHVIVMLFDRESRGKRRWEELLIILEKSRLSASSHMQWWYCYYSNWTNPKCLQSRFYCQSEIWYMVTALQQWSHPLFSRNLPNRLESICFFSSHKITWIFWTTLNSLLLKRCDKRTSNYLTYRYNDRVTNEFLCKTVLWHWVGSWNPWLRSRKLSHTR